MTNASDVIAGASIAVVVTGGLIKIIYDQQEGKIKDIKVVGEKQGHTISKIEMDIATILERCTGIKETIDKIESRTNR